VRNPLAGPIAAPHVSYISNHTRERNYKQNKKRTHGILTILLQNTRWRQPDCERPPTNHQNVPHVWEIPGRDHPQTLGERKVRDENKNAFSYITPGGGVRAALITGEYQFRRFWCPVMRNRQSNFRDSKFKRRESHSAYGV